MSATGLDRLFEQILAEPEGVEDPQVLAARSQLAAALPHLRDEIYEFQSAQSFLDRVAAKTSPAPPELVAAVTAEIMRETRKAAVTDPRRWAVPRWGWAAGAVAACVLAILATRLGEKDAALQVSIAPVSTVTTLQAPLKPDIASPVSQPPAAKPKRGLEPVYTTPNPPVALTSHAVTADDYPPASIRLQEQGSVKIQYTIGTDGAVSECAVTISSGVPRLDEAACILVKKWTFKPATVIGGAPVAVTIPAEIVFALK